MTLHITGDAAADRLLTDDPLALLIGMLLDQQVADGDRVRRARSRSRSASDRWMPRPSPATTPRRSSSCSRRLRRCTASPGRWPRACRRCAPPSSRTGAGMPPRSGRRDRPSGAEVLKRLKALPGFGEQKAKIFLALLGKQYGFTGDGWREASGAYGDDGLVPLRRRHHLGRVAREGARAQARDEVRGEGGVMEPTGGDVDAFIARVTPAVRRRDAGTLVALMRRVTGRGAGAVGHDHRLRRSTTTATSPAAKATPARPASRRARPRPWSTSPTASARTRRRSRGSAPTRPGWSACTSRTSTTSTSACSRRSSRASYRNVTAGVYGQRARDGGALSVRRPEALREVGAQALERHALLAHRVAVAHGDGAVVERVEVDRDAERRADLVLAAVAAADRAGVVEVDVPLAAQVVGDLARERREASRCATAAARRP